MSELLDFEGAEEPSFGGDFPKYLEKGTKVHGCLWSISDLQAFKYFQAKSDIAMLALNVAFRVVEHGKLNGYTIRDSIIIPADGTSLTVKSRESNDKLRKKFFPFGIDLAQFPCPVSGEEMIQMFNGKGPWAPTGGLRGKMVQLTCGDMRPVYLNQAGEKKGPYTKFGWFNPMDTNVRALLQPEINAALAKMADEDAKIAAATSGGLPDDMPF
jgi:hypothetical protein